MSVHRYGYIHRHARTALTIACSSNVVNEALGLHGVLHGTLRTASPLLSSKLAAISTVWWRGWHSSLAPVARPQWAVRLIERDLRVCFSFDSHNRELIYGKGEMRLGASLARYPLTSAPRSAARGRSGPARWARTAGPHCRCRRSPSSPTSTSPTARRAGRSTGCGCGCSASREAAPITARRITVEVSYDDDGSWRRPAGTRGPRCSATRTTGTCRCRARRPRRRRHRRLLGPAGVRDWPGGVKMASSVALIVRLASRSAASGDLAGGAVKDTVEGGDQPAGRQVAT
jgi:hypothetical protein